MVYGQKEELIFLGREISEQRDYSESVAQRIDHEVRGLVQEAYDRARKILRQYRAQLDLIAHRLIEVETIDREEFERLFNEPVQPKNGGTPVPVAAAAIG
jgi:cell division protease FtsH